MSNKTWFIPGNCPSLKNSKIATKRGVFASKTVTNYLRSLGIQSYSAGRKEVKEYKDTSRPNLFRKALESFPRLEVEDYPIKLGFYFIRKTRANFDFNNANQIILDLLTAHDFITDDSMGYVLPFPMTAEQAGFNKGDAEYFHVDKEGAGTIIKIL